MHFTIVSYTFPPSKEIGGRRWAKFSQHIIKSGHEVTVVCADNSGTDEWYHKEFTGINVKCLPKRYPDWLSGITKTFIEKFLYLFFTRVLSPFTKQNFYDKGFAWKKLMVKELEVIHQSKKIDVLIVSGAPFSLLYYGALFKKLHNEIVYISDFRDPWTWGSYYGIPNLSQIKKNFQLHSEYETLKESDIICAPTSNMIAVLKDKYSIFASKLYLLTHAYDPEKFSTINENGKREGFIYGGTLYNGIEEYIKSLSKIIKTYPNSGFKWDIYTGTIHPLIKTNFESGIINLHNFIPEEQLFQCISKSSAYLAFFPITDKDLVSTKFFEIIYTGTPILYIGEEGEVSKFIKENKVGIHILPSNMEAELPKYLNGIIPFEKGYFDVSKYSFSNVTDNFINKIKIKMSNQ
jgi:glycosyltransferase involved in cell wall biosynthesis